MNYRHFSAVMLLSAVIFCAPLAAIAESSLLPDFETFAADKYYRTELYFGTDKAAGGQVSDAEWNKFLADEVTARFPEGFTVLEGFGQYKDSSGKIVREASKVLVLFYPKKQRREINRKIEQLREIYKKQFGQESVLRLDFAKSVEVSF